MNTMEEVALLLEEADKELEKSASENESLKAEIETLKATAEDVAYVAPLNKEAGFGEAHIDSFGGVADEPASVSASAEDRLDAFLS